MPNPRSRASLTSRRSIFRPDALWPVLRAAALLLCTAGSALSQPVSPPPIVALGDGVVTGFSGVVRPDLRRPLPAGRTAADLTFINPEGPSARIVDLGNPGHVWDGRHWSAPMRRDILAKETGQVFGVALDDQPEPAIYLAATSAFGLHIVRRTAGGAMERLRTGAPRAQWQDGQFGLGLQGGPGSIYRVDGRTGAVSLFANVLLDGVPNPGPALGGLAYDPANRQLFVSDLYTGMVHRFSTLDGAEAGPPFDHGVTGRAAVNAPPVPFDPSRRLVITNAAFDTTNPETWGYAPPDRRVWGLALHGGRLYYSVRNGAPSEGPQIWSVGLQQNGDFAADPRWELDVPAQPGPYAVSDIAFSQRGAMILAQRAPVSGSYNYAAFTKPGEPRVLRFWQESPDDPATPGTWVPEPEEYAVGYARPYRKANGGVALGSGYDRNGRLVSGACEVALWTTGQDLRNDPALERQLRPGGPLVVHGLQGSPAAPVRTFNEPPAVSYFVDYDGRFDGPAVSGHVGGVRIRTASCPDAVAYGGPGGTSAPPYLASSNPPYVSGPETNPPGGGGCTTGLNADGTCGPVPVDLAIRKTAGPVRYDEATGAWLVEFRLTVTNVLNPFAPFNTIAINDAIPPGMALVSATGTGWACTGTLTCGFNFGSGIFPSGATLPDLVVVLTTKTPGRYRNCATVGLGSGSGLSETTLANNRDCAEVELRRRVDVAIEKTGKVQAAIDLPAHGGATTISYTLTVTNVGAAFPGGGAIVVTDTPPPGVTFTGVTAVPAGGWAPCALTAGSLSCTYSGSGPGTGVIGTITVTATTTGKGPWENCGQVAVAPSTATDTNLDNNKDCVTLKQPEIDISLAKTFEKGTSPGAGAFTLTVKNEKDAIVSPATAIRIVDPVPAGVTLTGLGGGSAANWSCTPAFPLAGPGTLTCTYTGPPATFATGAVLPNLVLTSTLAAAPGDNEVGIYRNCATAGLTAGGTAVTETDAANNTDCAVTNVINTTDCSVAGSCPKPEAVCKQDVLFIVDASVSIGGGLGSVKAAIGQFLQAMQNKGGSANIISFNNGGIGTTNPSWVQITSGTGGWVPVTSGNASTLATPIALGGTRTNWDDSLRRGRDIVASGTALLSPAKPLVIFITDGEPTAYNDNTSNVEIDANANPVTASAEAVTWINAIRALGSPVIAVGFGSVASLGYLDAAFTGNSTGPGNVNFDTASVIKMSSVGSLPGVMGTLGNQMCGTLSLNKSVSPNDRQHTLPGTTNPSLAVNDTFTFTLSLTNNAATPVTGIVVQDQVPAVLSNVMGTSAGVTAAGNLITWTIPTLGAHQTLTGTFTGQYVRTYTAPDVDTYTNFAQVTAATGYSATDLNDMPPVSGPVDEPDESSAWFRIRVTGPPPPPACDGPNQPSWCFLSVNKIRANPGAEDGSCTSSAPGGPANPCTFTINVNLSNIPPGSTVTVSDNLTLSGNSVTWPGTVAPAFCGTAGTLVSFSCPHSGLTSFSGPVTVMIPPGQSGPLQNCVTVTVANTTTTPPFNVTANSCAGVTLAQTQGLLACPPGTLQQGRACVAPPPPQCQPPMVPGPVAGRCVCPQGTTERGRDCVTLPPPPVCPPPLVPGLLPGSCLCPQGTVQQGRECVTVPPPPVCAPPMVPGPIAGSCVCPAGTVQQGRECVKRPPEACVKPKVPGPVAGTCVCPAGTVERGRECIRQVECRKPMIANATGTACVCPAGSVQQGRACIRPIECRAPARPNRAGTACVCPPGMVAQGQACLPGRTAPREPVDLPTIIRVPRAPREFQQDDRRERQEDRREPRGNRQEPGIVR
jgi:uncharacterized repeat protein (TIGR01451 family)